MPSSSLYKGPYFSFHAQANMLLPTITTPATTPPSKTFLPSFARACDAALTCVILSCTKTLNVGPYCDVIEVAFAGLGIGVGPTAPATTRPENGVEVGAGAEVEVSYASCRSEAATVLLAVAIVASVPDSTAEPVGVTCAKLVAVGDTHGNHVGETSMLELE